MFVVDFVVWVDCGRNFGNVLIDWWFFWGGIRVELVRLFVCVRWFCVFICLGVFFILCIDS